MNLSQIMDQDTMLITCILYRGGGVEVLKALHKRGINRTAMCHARGFAIGDPVGKKGLPAFFEKEIIYVLVSPETADEIFEFVFETSKIDRPYGGYIYMEKVRKATPYILMDIQEEDAKSKSS